jgi:DNA repair exonuclease SbcCD ATPase subunit
MTAQTSPAELEARILAEPNEERERLDAAAQAVRDEIAAIQAANAELRAEHDRAARQAGAQFEPAPEPPQLASIASQVEALERIRRARSGLQVARRAALADGAELVEEEWQLARALLDARARKITEQAERLAGEYRDWWRLVRAVRESIERRDPNRRVVNGPSTRMRAEPTTVDVIAAASGVDLCATLPLFPTAQPVTARA